MKRILVVSLFFVFSCSSNRLNNIQKSALNDLIKLRAAVFERNDSLYIYKKSLSISSFAVPLYKKLEFDFHDLTGKSTKFKNELFSQENNDYYFSQIPYEFYWEKTCSIKKHKIN